MGRYMYFFCTIMQLDLHFCCIVTVTSDEPQDILMIVLALTADYGHIEKLLTLVKILKHDSTNQLVILRYRQII